MPLPCPQVLSDILDLYLKTREDTWNSAFGVAKGTTKKIFGTIGNMFGSNIEDDATAKNEICDLLKVNFKKAKKVEDWVTIIEDLAEKAKKAQDQKYANDESLACETFHAIRNYIVRILTSSDDEYNTAFTAKRQLLIKKREDLDTAIKYSRTHNNSVGVTKLKAELENILIQLSFLGDEDSIHRAIDRRLFSYLKVLDLKEVSKSVNNDIFDDLNEEIPYCLQSKFCKMLYSHVYQRKTNISFLEFEQTAIATYKQSLLEKNRRDKEEQEAEKVVLQKFETGEDSVEDKNDEVKSALQNSNNQTNDTQEEKKDLLDEKVFSPTSGIISMKNIHTDIIKSKNTQNHQNNVVSNPEQKPNVVSNKK